MLPVRPGPFPAIGPAYALHPDALAPQGRLPLLRLPTLEGSLPDPEPLWLLAMWAVPDDVRASDAAILRGIPFGRDKSLTLG